MEVLLERAQAGTLKTLAPKAEQTGRPGPQSMDGSVASSHAPVTHGRTSGEELWGRRIRRTHRSGGGGARGMTWPGSSALGHCIDPKRAHAHSPTSHCFGPPHAGPLPSMQQAPLRQPRTSRFLTPSAPLPCSGADGGEARVLLDPGLVSELEQEFANLDANGDGVLSFEEFKAILGIQSTPEGLQLTQCVRIWDWGLRAYDIGHRPRHLGSG